MRDSEPEVISFDNAIKASAMDDRALLLGNGFSIAQGGARFGYGSLLEKGGLAADSPVRAVFETLKTCDFEKVMRALEDAAKVELAYGDNKKSKTFSDDASKVREALIHAIRTVHPGNQFEVRDIQRKACAAFLKHFSSIYTVNYDLLLYWVIVNELARVFSDGFGLGDDVDGFREYRTEAYCTTYYLHGALHLFLNSSRGTRKRVVTDATIVRDIERTIRESGDLPLIVAEGTSIQKLALINSVPYLRECYETLRYLSGSLFIFGHSIRNEDSHIYDAIFSGKVQKLFFCVHRPDIDWLPIRERLAPFRERNKKIEVAYVSAATAKIWG